MSISHSELQRLLHYDPETGIWTRRIATINSKPPGEPFLPTHNHGYVHIYVFKKKRLAHRLAVFYMTGEWPKGKIDHKNQNRANNSWKNIRPATQSRNAANSRIRKDNISGFRGVSWNATRKKWDVRITVKRKHIWLGRHADKNVAIETYKQAAIGYFGEFASVE